MEDNKVEIIAERITGWMKAQRMGDEANKPCFWSIYELSSISSKLSRNHPINSDNLIKEGLEESTEHLLQCMSFSTHVKYFAVRLRTEKGDTGVLNNFENPYYETPYRNSRPQIGNVPQANQGTPMMQMMIGLIQGMNEERAAQREETNALLTELRLQSQEREHKFKEYKSKEEIKRLKEENAAIKGGEENFLHKVIGELMPEIKQGLGKFISGENAEYRDDDLEEDSREEDGEQANDSKDKSFLNGGLEILSKHVDNPIALIYKMSIVIDYATEEERNSLLSMMQGRYDQIRNNKANEQ